MFFFLIIFPLSISIVCCVYIYFCDTSPVAMVVGAEREKYNFLVGISLFVYLFCGWGVTLLFISRSSWTILCIKWYCWTGHRWQFISKQFYVKIVLWLILISLLSFSKQYFELFSCELTIFCFHKIIGVLSLNLRRCMMFDISISYSRQM